MEELAKIPHDAYALWLKFVGLAAQSPIVATLFGFFAIIFIANQGSQVTNSAIAIYKANRTVFFISVATVAAASIALVVVARQHNLPIPSIKEPPSGAQIIGDSVLLQWKMHDTTLRRSGSSDNARYQLEIRRDGGTPEKIETFETYYNLHTIPGKFEWRVRSMIRSTNGAYRPESRWSAWQAQEFYRSVTQRIKMTREIRIAITKDPIAPFYFFDRKKRSDRGLDREIAELVVRRVAAHLQIKLSSVDWVPRPWLAGIAISLRRHDADFAIAETAISKKREAEYGIRFSSPYVRVPLAIIFRQDRVPNIELKDLKRYKFTAWRHTTAEALAKDMGLNVVPSSNAPELYRKLNDGKVDAIIDDYFLAAYLAQSVESNHKYRIIPIPTESVPVVYKREFSYPTPAGIFVSETSSGLLGIINRVLAEAATKNAIARITKEYLGKYYAKLPNAGEARGKT